MAAQIYFENYSPVGDLTVAAVCLLIFWLILTSYIKKTKAFGIYLNIVVYLLLAAISNVACHHLYTLVTDNRYTPVYVLRIIYHALLFSNLLLYVVYIVTMQRLEKRKRLIAMMVSSILYISVIAVDIVTTIRGTGFKLDGGGRTIRTGNLFIYGDVAFILIILFLMIVFRNRLFNRVMYGFYGTVAISFLLLLVQGLHGQTSFTTVSFLFPAIATLYILHANPYNVELGSIDAKAMEDMVRSHHKRGQELLYMSLYLPEFEKSNTAYTDEIQRIIRRFSESFFRNAVLFQVTNAHIILMAPKKQNPDHKITYERILAAFQDEYEKFHYDYKIVAGTTHPEISERDEHIQFINAIHRQMGINEAHIVTEEDITRYRRNRFIVSELSDIYKQGDLRDPRVLVYCQPVYNISSGRYDTAEALMRLDLPGIGMVFPDQFIPLAEEYNYIHVLTKIILQKTCDAIHKLQEQSYDVRRISVNVSVVEFHEDDFMESFSRVIRETGIPEEKIAIEITESQMEKDFVGVKKKIEALKAQGISFYLDDFGTGYSNMERIMELPFDIIKFDRTLVIASDMDERSRKMVFNMANMFREMHYAVLYEGVEDENDESRCIDMSANYLQGYKYSRPIPISELSRFLSKAE